MPAQIKRPKPRKVWARTPTAHRDRARAAGFPPFQTIAKRVWLPLGGTGVSTGSLRLARLLLRIAREHRPGGLGFLSGSHQGSEQSTRFYAFADSRAMNGAMNRGH